MRPVLRAGLMIVLCVTPDAAAQGIDTTRVTPATASPGRRLAARTTAGYMGVIPGAFAGGVAGAWVERHSSYTCNCDDPGLAGFVLGGMIGSAVATSLFEAGLRMPSPCTFKRRWGRAFAGAAVTLLPGAIGLASGNDGGWALVLIPPLLAPMASAMALDRC